MSIPTCVQQHALTFGERGWTFIDQSKEIVSESTTRLCFPENTQTLRFQERLLQPVGVAVVWLGRGKPTHPPAEPPHPSWAPLIRLSITQTDSHSLIRQNLNTTRVPAVPLTVCGEFTDLLREMAHLLWSKTHTEVFLCSGHCTLVHTCGFKYLSFNYMCRCNTCVVPVQYFLKCEFLVFLWIWV